jgi:hypothetical protein
VGFGVLRSAPLEQAPNFNLLTIVSTTARPTPKPLQSLLVAHRVHALPETGML